MKKLLFFVLLGVFIISGCSNSSTNSYIKEDSNYTTPKSQVKNNNNYITIKYRDTSVDVSGFLTVNTSSSSFIEEAYYDPDNQYLILNLNGVYYHWCDVPQYIRDEFKEADSFGKYYNQYIKGDYDCRFGYVPQYE